MKLRYKIYRWLFGKKVNVNVEIVDKTDNSPFKPIHTEVGPEKYTYLVEKNGFLQEFKPLKKPIHGIPKSIIEKYEEHYMEKEDPKKYYICPDKVKRILKYSSEVGDGVPYGGTKIVLRFMDGKTFDEDRCEEIVYNEKGVKKYYLCADNVSRILKSERFTDGLDYDRHYIELEFEDGRISKKHLCTEITEDQYNKNKELKFIKINENDLWYVEESETHWQLFLRQFLGQDGREFDGYPTKSEVHPMQIVCCSKNGYYPNEIMTKFMLTALNHYPMGPSEEI